MRATFETLIEFNKSPSKKKQKLSAQEARKLSAIANAKKDRKTAGCSMPNRESRPMETTRNKKSERETKRAIRKEMAAEEIFDEFGKFETIHDERIRNSRT